MKDISPYFINMLVLSFGKKEWLGNSAGTVIFFE